MLCVFLSRSGLPESKHRFLLLNHRRPKLTFRESEELIYFQFIHIGVTAVRVGT